MDENTELHEDNEGTKNVPGERAAMHRLTRIVGTDRAEGTRSAKDEDIGKARPPVPEPVHESVAALTTSFKPKPPRTEADVAAGRG